MSLGIEGLILSLGIYNKGTTQYPSSSISPLNQSSVQQANTKLAVAQANLKIADSQIFDVYDRQALKKEYSDRNKGNPLKAKSLKVIYLNNEEQRKKLASTLKSWKEIAYDVCFDLKMELKKFQESSKEYQVLLKEHRVFSSTSSVADQALTALVRGDKKQFTAVVDDSGVIQGISVTTPDKDDKDALECSFLVVAPHNIHGKVNKQPQVEGVGSALIEDVVVQALNLHGLKPKSLCSDKMKNVAVILQALKPENEFYEHIFFVKYASPTALTNYILTGNNLLKFLKKYGGRAAPSD